MVVGNKFNALSRVEMIGKDRRGEIKHKANNNNEEEKQQYKDI